MFEWEDYFEPHILARGRDYYRQGAVRKFVRKEDSIEAVVEGTEYYKVTVSFSGPVVSGAGRKGGPGLMVRGCGHCL